jgi:hypothetical protein
MKINNSYLIQLIKVFWYRYLCLFQGLLSYLYSRISKNNFQIWLALDCSLRGTDMTSILYCVVRTNFKELQLLLFLKSGSPVLDHGSPVRIIVLRHQDWGSPAPGSGFSVSGSRFSGARITHKQIEYWLYCNKSFCPKSRTVASCNW